MHSESQFTNSRPVNRGQVMKTESYTAFEDLHPHLFCRNNSKVGSHLVDAHNDVQSFMDLVSSRFISGQVVRASDVLELRKKISQNNSALRDITVVRRSAMGLLGGVVFLTTIGFLIPIASNGDPISATIRLLSFVAIALFSFFVMMFWVLSPPNIHLAKMIALSNALSFTQPGAIQVEIDRLIHEHPGQANQILEYFARAQITNRSITRLEIAALDSFLTEKVR